MGTDIEAAAIAARPGLATARHVRRRGRVHVRRPPAMGTAGWLYGSWQSKRGMW